MNQSVTFATLPIPQPLGRVEFRPTLESVKKLGYGVDDESGWLVGDPADEMVHPVLLSTYLWWPQGFYVQESTGIGHFQMFKDRFPGLFDYPYLHGKTHARFVQPFKAGSTLFADVSVCEKYERRNKEFIVIRAQFSLADGSEIAEYRHTVMLRSHAPIRGLAASGVA
ncbi:MAG: hypothetical protein AB7L76_15890 [Burkholderiaceae bacterium]